ncbi:MAG: type I DNA topoisomerase [Bacteroides sp.]|nr:type I DNA topoisomerase [Eubacterium sp.]MCM1418579.1 type I DNA topoisomerase [Roseburia sp.]MCM1462634.1 type I DNA topoisomerase [Bacteroides sp.]
MVISLSNLVIVESPTKVKTVKKILGKDYEVVASAGHIRDLPKSKFGVDIENGFLPCYENKRDKSALIKELKSQAKNAEVVYLATDPDREGEAISWHLANVLKLDDKRAVRVTFSEITKTGIENGMAHPRGLDMDLINAQQARRILDRIVGYKLSPFLWKKVRRGLSAGRVQSAVVRLIVDREKEIEAFESKEYWSVDAKLKGASSRKTFPAKLAEIDGKKAELGKKDETDAVLERLKNADFIVNSIKKSVRKKQPAPPFTTSTLQQEASRRLSFNARRTMKAAQELYEGVDIEGQGTIGLITYMRTDSLRVSEEAQRAAAALIEERYGKDYLPPKPRVYKSKSNAQDAHEAIRPSVVEILPETAKKTLTSDQYKLYRLIWERFMASQMANALLDAVAIDVEAAGCLFKASGFTVRFDGFTRLYEESADNADDEGGALPKLNEGERLAVAELNGNQHFTQPPPRYNEASLIKAMEEYGIGRPSTYAPTISTILDRHYVEREQRQLKPTPLGVVITDLLSEHFERIVDTKFTAQMERELDEIEEGKTEWVKVLDSFYGDFAKTLEKAEKDMDGKRVKIPNEPTDIVCEQCGKRMLIKIGPYGKFLGCEGFPDCKNTKKIVNETGGKCPKCGSRMLAKKSRKGKPFFGCEDYKNCGYMTWDTPIADLCPRCGATLFKKVGKKGKVYCAKEGCGYETEAQAAEEQKE